MMEFLTPIQQFIERLDEKQFKIYMLSFLGGIALAAGLLIFNYYRSVSSYKTKIIALNKKRKEVSELLTRYELVKKQQKDVDALLSKEKDFKITQYFEKVLAKINATKNQKSVDTRSEDVLENYTEWTLSADLSNLNMQKLTELLNELEAEDRIYIKELEITRAGSSAINVKISIATLEPKAETGTPQE